MQNSLNKLGNKSVGNPRVKPVHFPNPQWDDIIQPGLDKLESYQAHLADMPVYVVAMGELIQVYIGLE